MSKKNSQKIVKCSFCGRDGSEVGSMIAGPDVYICDICISSSVEILRNNLAAYPGQKSKDFKFIPIQRFKYHVVDKIKNLKDDDFLHVLNIMKETAEYCKHHFRKIRTA